MPKRKKHTKLPNGYGSIRYLGSGRRNPYAVHPPAHENPVNGMYVVPRALCYVDDWYVGFAVLTAYKAGTYVPGMEGTLKSSLDSLENADTIIKHILSDYSGKQQSKSPTYAEVYEAFYANKFHEGHQYSKSCIYGARMGFKHSANLHDREFRSITAKDLQDTLDACPLKHSSLEQILNLYHSLYHYADGCGWCDKDYSKFVSIKTPDDDEHGVPFTKEELQMLWSHNEDPIIELLLIMCYSGHRISELKVIEVDLTDYCFRGGLKTRTSRERIVPIHSAILPLVKRRLARDGALLCQSTNTYRKRCTAALDNLGILGDPKHTPHDCRHTFSALLEDAKVSDNDRKRLMGHSFKDVTNKVYGHRDLSALRAEIERIKVVTSV